MPPARRRGARPSSSTVHAIARRACAESGDALSPELLTEYLHALANTVRRRRRLDSDALDRCRRVGTLAAAEGVALASIVDAYLSATRLAWTDLRELISDSGGVRRSAAAMLAEGQTVLRAADDALAAVAAGYADARSRLLRQEEAVRREFIDDLLGGQAAAARLIARADRFGIRVSAPHLVAVAVAGAPFGAASLAMAGVEELLRARLGVRDIVVATKDGRLVCVVPTAGDDAAGRAAVVEILGEVVSRAARQASGADGGTQVGVGRAYPGPAGIATSYREGCEALDLAARLGWGSPVVDAERLGVYRVLMRDIEAITGLVESVLGPLRSARGGAEPLLETLSAYLANGAVATEAARDLHLSVRAVTYRLARIHALTGYNPTDPGDWLTLQVARTGAKLLGWPHPSVEPPTPDQ